MVKVNILYPAAPDARFDMEYYLGVHMPMSIELLSRAGTLKGVSVERGLAGAAPGAPATFVALCNFEFESVDAFMAAFLPHAEILRGDMKNYTDIEPVIQFSDVIISR